MNRTHPDAITVTRTTYSGSTNEAGQPASSSTSTIYDGPADMQRADRRMRRRPDRVDQVADVTGVLPDHRMDAIGEFEESDDVEWNGDTYRIVEVHPLDAMFFAVLE